ncbi:MAG: fibronectin type III domain-containing protein [Verrucomicrobiota bacterium]|nr:fibronectin type III domain-containing protein [Verrucomicrobiota bacterium]
MAGKFGSRWSTMWAQAGFTDATTSVPRRAEAQQGLAMQLLTANPSCEVGSMGFTADDMSCLRNTTLTAQQAVIATDVVPKSKGDAVEDNDPRWLTFGLQMQATDTTPGQPVNVTAHTDESGNVMLSCDATALATRYRWRALFPGVETDYRLLERSTEPMANVSGVTPGRTIQIIVQAVNGGLQSVASEPIKFTMPLAATAARASEPVVTEAVVVPVERNGSNGHTNGTRMPALS